MKYFLIICLVLLIAADNNTIEALVDRGYSPSLIMIYRGSIAFVLFLCFALLKKQDLKPKKWKPHIFRLLINGLSVWFLVNAFRYLSAGTVALFQRMDIPLLILIAVFTRNKKSSLQFYLSIWTIFIIIFFVLSAEIIEEDNIGFIYTTAGVILAAISYIIIKKQSASENPYSLGLIYFFGIIMWGVGFCLYEGQLISILWDDVWIFLMGGISLFLIAFIALKLFKIYPAEKVRLPYAIGALATLGLEMIIETKVFSTSHIGLSVLLTGIMTTICLNPKVPVIGESKKKTSDKEALTLR